MPKTHEQTASKPIDRELVKRAADLCRAQPALFARVVRYSDELERGGVDSTEALRQALDLAGW